MKNKLNLLQLFLILASSLYSSQESRWSINVNYGLQYNHFVDYGRTKKVVDNYLVPTLGEAGDIEHYQKRNIGVNRGLEVQYSLSDKNIIGLGFEETVNQGKYDVTYRIANNIVPIFIQNFSLKNKNTFYELFYKRGIGNSNNLFLLGGITYFTSVQQEITVAPQDFVEITQRDKKKYNIENGGLFFGAEYYFYETGKFRLGVRSKMIFNFYDFSDVELENISLTPILSYNF